MRDVMRRDRRRLTLEQRFVIAAVAGIVLTVWLAAHLDLI